MTIEQPQWETLISETDIARRIKELALEIADAYQGNRLLVVGVLRGAFIFTADLVRELSEYLPDLEVDFVAISSYSDSEESSRTPRIQNDINTDIEGRHVLPVEDIVDTGYSFEKLLKIFQARSPRSLRTCALLSKPDRREVDVPLDFVGFTIENRWVEGYGLDSAQKGRGRKEIAVKS